MFIRTQMLAQVAGFAMAGAAALPFLGPSRAGAVDGASSALFAASLAARTCGQVLWCITRPDLFAPALFQAGLEAFEEVEGPLDGPAFSGALREVFARHESLRTSIDRNGETLNIAPPGYQKHYDALRDVLTRNTAGTIR